MAGPFFLSSLLAFLAVATGAPSVEKCCSEKMVGGVNYRFVGEGMTGAYRCLSDCIYERVDSPGSKFCFAAGDLEVVCEDAQYTTDSSGSTDEIVTEEIVTDEIVTDEIVTYETTTESSSTDEIVTRVQGYIDAGTCGSISCNGNEGTSAESYYNEFTYNGKRVIISSQVPDHDAENDAINPNPNTRCERWQFIELPIDPSKASTSTATSLGTIGHAVTGGVFFNHWSSPNGDLAITNEGPSLDSCFGHSAPEGAYHYHANINCSSTGAATGANDPDTCLQIGYYKDGVPIYGLCKDSNDMQMTSCYSLNNGATTTSVTTAGGTYSVGSVDTDYSYDSSAFTAGDCNLDDASGAIHPTTGKYSYFTTTGYPWVPILYYGDQGTSTECSAA